MPNTNNVYGYFTSRSNLEKLASIFKRRLSDHNVNIVVNKSHYDGTQSIQLNGDKIEFDSTLFNNEGRYSFNGAVAGSESEIYEVVNEIFTILKEHKFKPVFEVYNESFECIAEFKS
ncbi:hypothetical protein [Pleionea sediminis]|uniref:hypothetical protein n=1 Tax=Pleionea sediminis TaxID=2569479 RepID=UPI001185B949|nr:hypothetical protein [Pleionea sediminis]